ncbi:MAG: dihydropteroate synthase, partial [Bacteroidota bacterium]
MLHPQTTINCNGRLLSFDEPKIMGVLNVTKDSFFDGGRYNGLDAALIQAEHMLSEGADIIDIGGMSSRPGAELISPKEEQARILPIIKELNKRFPEAFISVDTVYSSTVERVAEEGADMINDISAGAFDDKMYETVANLDIPYILMHMQG